MMAKKKASKKRLPYLSWGKAFGLIGAGHSQMIHCFSRVKRGEARYVAIRLHPEVRSWAATDPIRSKATAIKLRHWFRRGYLIKLTAILAPDRN